MRETAGQTMPPRNRVLYEQGQALRAEIRALLLAHPPGFAPLTAKHIRGRLTREPLPALETISWHIRHIRADLQRSLQPSQFIC